MNYFVFLKEQQERNKLKKQVQENAEITFMSALFVMGVFFSFINYLFDAILKEVN